MNLKKLFFEACDTSYFLEGFDIEDYVEGDKSFIVIGPLLPQCGYAFSDYLNREFFKLDASKVDLYSAQNIQRKISKENSFVKNDNGEYVYVNIDGIKDKEILFLFLRDNITNIKYVISNASIDRY